MDTAFNYRDVELNIKDCVLILKYFKEHDLKWKAYKLLITLKTLLKTLCIIGSDVSLHVCFASSTILVMT